MLLFLVYNLIRFIVNILPLEVSYRGAIFLADCHFMRGGADRRAVIDNLKAAGITDPNELSSTARAIFRNFAKYLVEFFRFAKMDEKCIQENVKFVGRENLDRALKKNKGVIIASGHIGNWEMGAAAIARRGYKLSVVAMVHKHPLVNSLFVNQRHLAGVGVFHLGDDARGTLEAFNNNELVAIVGDRDFAQNGVKIQFFNREVNFPRGSALLHIKKGTPIIPTYVMRQSDNTFQLIFEPEIKVELTGDKKVDQKNIVQEWARGFEKYVREYPSQWSMFRRFWDKDANKI